MRMNVPVGGFTACSVLPCELCIAAKPTSCYDLTQGTLLLSCHQAVLTSNIEQLTLLTPKRITYPGSATAAHRAGPCSPRHLKLPLTTNTHLPPHSLAQSADKAVGRPLHCQKPVPRGPCRDCQAVQAGTARQPRLSGACSQAPARAPVARAPGASLAIL